jgi:hypothetical protein
MPIAPNVIFSLGATAPSRPSAEAGIIQGTAKTLLVASVRLINCRRLSDPSDFFVIFIELLILPSLSDLSFLKAHRIRCRIAHLNRGRKKC